MSVVRLPWPPSVNHYWVHAHRGTFIGAKGKAYRTDVLACVLKEFGAPKRAIGRLKVHVIAYPPDKRKRDLDNIWKAILDSCTHAGLWLDDSQIDDLHIVRGDPETDGGIFLMFEEIDA